MVIFWEVTDPSAYRPSYLALSKLSFNITTVLESFRHISHCCLGINHYHGKVLVSCSCLAHGHYRTQDLSFRGLEQKYS